MVISNIKSDLYDKYNSMLALEPSSYVDLFEKMFSISGRSKALSSLLEDKLNVNNNMEFTKKTYLSVTSLLGFYDSFHNALNRIKYDKLPELVDMYKKSLFNFVNVNNSYKLSSKKFTPEIYKNLDTLDNSDVLKEDYKKSFLNLKAATALFHRYYTYKAIELGVSELYSKKLGN